MEKFKERKMPFPFINPNEQLNLKDLEENLEELLARCRQLRQDATQELEQANLSKSLEVRTAISQRTNLL
jgi:hypothetical protein